jgi:CheY-like chemotaxis protein
MTKPRVLLVEDESLVAMIIEDMLADLGVEVVASFGALNAALSWVEDGAEPFDGALLDVNLGGELVFPLAEALQARGVPFAFVTAYGVLPGERFPGSPVVPKPVDSGALHRAVAAFSPA